MSDIALRPFGCTGIEVSCLGLGCNRIGEELLGEHEWVSLLHEAVDLGVTVFDTAQQYAGGRSQKIIGTAFANRDDVVIATKVSPVKLDEGHGFTRLSVIQGVEDCLRDLQRDCIDILQTHGSGNRAEVSNPELAEAVEELKAAGKIRAFGSATFSAEGAVYAIEHGLVDMLQITYNLIDRSHADPVLPHAERNGTGLLARMPYQRGTLTGKFAPGTPVPQGHRARLQGEQLEQDIAHAERFRDLGQSRPGGMTALAMQYVLADHRIATVIPGARSREQLRANVEAALAPPLTAEEHDAIEAIRAKFVS